MTRAVSTYQNEHISMPLTDAPACAEGPAVFFASAYIVPNSKGLRKDILLGKQLPDTIGDTVALTNERVNKGYSTGAHYRAAALLIVRFCLNNHPDEKSLDYQGPRMEIGETFIATDPGSERYPMPTGQSTQPNYHFASRVGSDANRQVHPLILPRAVNAPLPTELVRVPQYNTYIYAALNGTEQLIGSA